MRRLARLALTGLLLAGAAPALAQGPDLNTRDALRAPPARPGLLGPGPQAPSRLERQQAERYRDQVKDGIRQLERHGDPMKRETQERLWQLRGELNRIDNRLRDTRER